MANDTTDQAERERYYVADGCIWRRSDSLPLVRTFIGGYGNSAADSLVAILNANAELLAAARDVANIAFAVCQRDIAGTPLHEPMQRLINAVAAAERAGGREGEPMP